MCSHMEELIRDTKFYRRDIINDDCTIYGIEERKQKENCQFNQFNIKKSKQNKIRQTTQICSYRKRKNKKNIRKTRKTHTQLVWFRAIFNLFPCSMVLPLKQNNNIQTLKGHCRPICNLRCNNNGVFGTNLHNFFVRNVSTYPKTCN